MPRARELVGLCGPVPTALDCLLDHPPGGTVAADQTKAVTKCAAGIEKAAAKFAATKLRTAQRCVDRVFACLETKPSGDPCATDVQAKCTKDRVPVDKAHAKLLESVAAKCGGVTFDVLRSAAALDLDADAESCDSIGAALASAADYAECVARRHACFMNSLLVSEVPLAELFIHVADQRALFALCN